MNENYFFNFILLKLNEIRGNDIIAKSKLYKSGCAIWVKYDSIFCQIPNVVYIEKDSELWDMFKDTIINFKELSSTYDPEHQYILLISVLDEEYTKLYGKAFKFIYNS